MKLKQFGYWNQEDSELPQDGFWMIFNTIEDAVSEGGDGVEIFAIKATSLGMFERKVSIVNKKTKKVHGK
jgi:hypothetical protein